MRRLLMMVVATLALMACDGRTLVVASPPDASADGEPLRDADGIPRQDPPSSSAIPGNHRLHLVTRHGVPLTDAGGIACADTHVWLSTAGHNASQHTLAYVRLATSAIEKQFTLTNLIEQPGTGAYGITVLNGFVFMSVAGNTNKIVRVDPTTGEVVQTFAAPTALGPSDLDVSGEHIVESDGTGQVFTLAAATGAVVRSFAAGALGRNMGIAVRGNEAFVGSLFGGMERHDVTTGAHLGSVTKEDGTALAGDGIDLGSMCFNGSRLLILSKLGISEYDVVAGL
ncbi:MAG: hypothetical protein KF819_04645 [Labilithrix sp.]|nr:hypothetical protein [Labilithrix sp.]